MAGIKRLNLVTEPTSREKQEKKKVWGSKYSADTDKVSKSDSVDVPDRMEVVFRENPMHRWLCLTPKEWNQHVGYCVGIPVTLEKTKIDPFEYQFVLDRVSQIALCSQPRSMPIKSPYFSMGKLSRADHVQISKVMAKILFDPSIADTL
jgi:mRNA-degrading endonuclease toxin of MazEF toxin-antitoxin module